MRKRNVHIQFWLDKKEAETLRKRVKRSGLFFSGKILSSWMPSHRKQGCWLFIGLIPLSRFLHTTANWKAELQM